MGAHSMMTRFTAHWQQVRDAFTGGISRSIAAAALILASCAPSAAPPIQLAASGVADPAPGNGWATFITEACEWSNERTPPGECFGRRGVGYQVRPVYRVGDRWLVWDPNTRDVAFVDREALSLPAELTVLDFAPAASVKSVVICVDRSARYRHTAAALTGLVEWVRRVAHPGDTYFLRWIEDNSYRPEAALGEAIRLSPGPRPPAPVALPVVANPYDHAAKARATATVQAALDEQRRFEAQLEQAKRKARQELDGRLEALRALRPAPAAASDPLGCVAKAAELLAGEPGDRWIIVASHLDQDPVPAHPIRLDGIRVRAPYFQCDDPASCERRRTTWSQFAAGAGAADMRFLDPAQGTAGIEK